MRDKITAKWTQTGLLDDTPEEIDKMLLSHNLENCAKYLLSQIDDYPNKEETNKAELFLPIVVMLFRDKNIRIIESIEGLYEKFNKFYIDNYQNFKELNYLSKDGDVEFCSEFVKFYEMP